MAKTTSALVLVLPLLSLVAAACDDNVSARPDGGSGGAGGGAGGAGGTPISQKLVILHTNDLHSHLMGHGPEADYSPATLNDDATIGGFARLATAIGTAKGVAAADGAEVLLLDAGDFMMGTLFEFLGTAAAPELTLMKSLGYDATTIGNHELDWTPTGLAGILAAATMNGMMPTVPIVASNMKFSDSPGDDQLEALATAGIIQNKLVKDVGMLKVGFFGLLGADAVQVTPQAAPLTFEPIAAAAARMVTELRETDKVDLVIALSHSGISSLGTGEDLALAMAVPGIDIIISGHTHDKLDLPKLQGKTIIVTAGSYGSNLGKMALTVTKGATPGAAATVVLDRYSLEDIDDSVMGAPTVQGAVDQYIAGLDGQLAAGQLMYKKVIAETAADLALPIYAEAPVGNLVADAYRLVTTQLQPTAPPVIGAEANGQLRTPILKGTTGKIWLADLFRVTPIGIGPDQKPGFPLVTFYLNAKDLASGLELGAAGPAVPDQYFLQVSGLKVEYDMTKPVFGRVASLTLTSGPSEQVLNPADLTTCYKIVTTNYVAGLLGVVKTFTQNLLSVVAKDADCATPIDPTTRFVDADPAAAGTQELKHWQAVMKYVGGPAFTDTNMNGIPDVPAVYAMPQGRIVKR
jgi:5'-nucleotidase/UDP-sugar diphosphatase